MSIQNTPILRRAAVTGLSLSAMLALAACGAVTENGGGNAGSTDETNTEELVIGTAQDIDTVDTHSTTAITTEAVMVNLQSYLLRRDDDSNLEPLLAESYESVDEETWRFTLNEGITFHNGDPLTAEDVKFSLERVAGDDTLAQHANFNSIVEVNIIDDHNFEIITDGPDPALPYRLAREGAGILPQNYIQEEGWEGYMAHPVGSGPYEFVDWVEGDSFTMARYEDYFGGDVADWETVVFRTIAEDSTRMNELLAGGVDIVDMVPAVDQERVEEEEGVELASSETTTVQRLYVNQNEGQATEDPLVREAIDYAIDNEAMSDIFQNSEGVPTRTALVPGAVGFEEDLYDTFRYDPDHARDLLEEAGYGEDELEVSLTASQNRTAGDSDIAQTIVGMLEEVGIVVNLQLLEASQYVDTRTGGDFDELLITGWNNTLYDGSHSLGHFHSEYQPDAFGYNNPEVDALLEAGEVNMDEGEREEQYQQVQEIVAEDLPYIYLYNQAAFYGVRENLDFEPRADDMYYVEDINPVN